jgi:hypothetical protein
MVKPNVTTWIEEIEKKRDFPISSLTTMALTQPTVNQPPLHYLKPSNP